MKPTCKQTTQKSSLLKQELKNMWLKMKKRYTTMYQNIITYSAWSLVASENFNYEKKYTNKEFNNPIWKKNLSGNSHIKLAFFLLCSQA